MKSKLDEKVEELRNCAEEDDSVERPRDELDEMEKDEENEERCGRDGQVVKQPLATGNKDRPPIRRTVPDVRQRDAEPRVESVRGGKVAMVGTIPAVDA